MATGTEPETSVESPEDAAEDDEPYDGGYARLELPGVEPDED